MKQLFLLLCAIIVSGAAHSQSANAVKADLKNISWLTGKWSRTNAKPGRSGYEIWKSEADTVWIGRGINMRGSDTTFVEKLKIVQRNQQLYYVADVPNNAQPVNFLFTSIDATGFTCENPQHDFPKKITYTLIDNRMRAVISGNGQQIEYWFERMQ